MTRGSRRRLTGWPEHGFETTCRRSVRLPMRQTSTSPPAATGNSSMHRTRTAIMLALMCVASTAVAGDAWWRICRPLPASARPRRDPCAHEKFKWAASEVLRAPKVCISRTVSLRNAVRAYQCAWRDALNAPKHCHDARESCDDAIDAYRTAAAELRCCHECEQHGEQCTRCQRRN